MIKLGRSFWWVIFLLIASFLLSRIPNLSGNPIYLRLFILFLLILLTSGLWTILSVLHLEVIRTTRVNRKPVGEVFSENFEVINRSIIPKVWLKISDQSDLPGGAGSRVLTFIGGKQTRAYIAHSYLMQRGWFQLGPTQISTGDFFGLFLAKKEFPGEDMLLVLPHMVSIREFPAPFGILPGGRALRQKTLEVTPYAAGVREFVQGDPLKSIHWPSSARKQRLMVKEFEKDPLAEVWIFVDMQRSVHYSAVDEDDARPQEINWLIQKQPFRLPPETEEYAISIGASLANYYIQQKREVGLIAAGQKYAVLPAERGERQLGKILETLAVLRAEGDLPLSGLISTQIVHLTRGSTIIMISPSADQKIFTVAVDLIQRGLKPVVILIDQASFGGGQSSEDLRTLLVNHGVLIFTVRNGDNLKSVLESPGLLLTNQPFFRNQ